MADTDFPRPPHNIAPIPDLQIWDGFACDLCEFIITSWEVMRWRHKKAHRDVLNAGQTFYRPVKVQVNPLPVMAQLIY